MDFYQIKERNSRHGLEIYPDFKVSRSKDLMVRGKSFYAIWDEEKQLWSTDEYDVQRLVDQELMEYRQQLVAKTDEPIQVKLMADFSTNSWAQFRNFIGHISDNSHQLDENLTFANTPVKKKDYISRRLPYSLEEGSTEAYEELIGTLYEPEERQKLEWAIGAIVSGDSKTIQKFVVLYGETGSGKSTFLNVIHHLFPGYYTTFDSKALTSGNNTFSTEVFKGNPLIAIQHEGDLSRIEDNTKLNSIISHEEMTMNEKHKPSYTARLNCFLFMATNKAVKITDAKSGIIRRLIDVRPSGNRIPTKKYQTLTSQIDFELGAIAHKCLKVYRDMGKNYYSGYRPLDMMLQTDVFYNFVESNYYVFRENDEVSLSQAYEMYKTYCDEALIEFKLPRHKFREELKNYFLHFSDLTRINGRQTRSTYSGFITEKFTSTSAVIPDELPNSLVLDNTKSLIDEAFARCPAQYAYLNQENLKQIPSLKWVNVKTKLSELDTSLLHYVKVPDKHIVIDFDLKDEDGKKALERNLEEASSFPATYAELSKSRNGLHLHYIYDGDVNKLSHIYAPGIEIKTFNGDASLRRQLSKCNNIPIAHISSGLPLKGEKMINITNVQSEKGLRELITRNLNKEIHAATAPSVSFIHKILEDAYSSDLVYDVTNMRQKILTFAMSSTNQAEFCVKLVSDMKFHSGENTEPLENNQKAKSEELVFFDAEVFPNLVMISWKYAGEDHKCVRMINPTSKDVEGLLSMNLIGFNCRRYDNHILYAIYLGYSIEDVYALSQKIISGSRNSLFREAYNVSYADVYEFSSLRQSLKKFQIDLGIHHQELGFPWDQPVPEEKWFMVGEYCDNDVHSLEAVFNSRKEDFEARQILAELSGLTINDTNQMHAAKIMFGNDKNPQSKFVYSDLSVMFVGYQFKDGKSSYRGEDPGEGGYVYSEPGMYEDVVVLDIASMHPASIEQLNLFGPYTEKYSNLKTARVAIKNKDFDTAKKMLNGVLAKYLTNTEKAGALADALKAVLVTVYGLTYAKFDNKFKDIRNIDNIVAKRGALFMIDLKKEVQKKGFTVIHIKTDSIKIKEATSEIIQFVIDFGKEYGYDFEQEAAFEKMCLVNKAVYVAKYRDGAWTATGAEFAHPYVFKTLFSHEPIAFEDLCETKSVTTSLHLDMNEGLSKDEHIYQFVGRVGSFCPMKPGTGGGILLREKEGSFSSATESKGFRWLESEVVRTLNKQDDIDMNYFNGLVDSAVDHISEFGDLEWFTASD